MSKVRETKPKQTRSKKYMLVRYGRMNSLGFFEHRETKMPKVTTHVVVKTDKGLELGRVVGQLSSYRAGQFKLNQNEVKEYFGDNDIDLPAEQGGKFLRFATAEDISEQGHLRKITREEMECCKRFVQELDLPMKIVDAEHIFGGERIIFYFMSEGRVDFRELVKKLAHEYQTRIEMRQIGSRDEAKLLGDIESCGQECCCRRFLRLLKPVNMRMAKMQKATLDPTKISGYCGRLKCCLRYEDKTYTELKKKLPKKNTKVKTKHGEGKVVDTQILTQLVVVEYESGERVAEPVDELEIIAPPQQPAEKKKDSTAQDKKTAKGKKATKNKKTTKYKKAAEDRNAEEAEKTAEDEKTADAEKVTEDKKTADAEKVTEDKKVAEDEKTAEDKKVAEDEKTAEDNKVAEDEKTAEDNKAVEDKQQDNKEDKEQ